MHRAADRVLGPRGGPWWTGPAAAALPGGRLRPRPRALGTAAGLVLGGLLAQRATLQAPRPLRQLARADVVITRLLAGLLRRAPPGFVIYDLNLGFGRRVQVKRTDVFGHHRSCNCHPPE